MQRITPQGDKDRHARQTDRLMLVGCDDKATDKGTPTPEQSKKTSYRLGRAGAKQTREAVREEAKSRKHVTQTPTLRAHKHRVDRGRKKNTKNV